MKTIGIIAEYNPFHNGHAYQIQKIKEDAHADYVVVAMSGDFVQRGEPAIIDKYARTEMALCCGADAVFELPAIWATAAAEDFAAAGVLLLHRMGCVNELCFGAETDDLPRLISLADILSDEPDDYRAALKKFLSEGNSFPTARSLALQPYKSILSSPNNILAVEYLKALKKYNCSMKPHLIARIGNGYHETSLYGQAVPSASAIRRELAFTHMGDNTISPLPHMDDNTISTAANKDNNRISTIIHGDNNRSSTITCEVNNKGTLPPSLSDAMPAEALSVLSAHLPDGLLFPDDFSSPLAHRLLCLSAGELAAFAGCDASLANRFYKNRMSFTSFSRFCELNKRKNVTYSHISRALLHILLGITEQDYALGKSLGFVPYLRLLGFRERSASLLSEIKRRSSIPLLTKLSHAKNALSEDALPILERDIFAADFYELVRAGKNRETDRHAVSEYRREIVRIAE